MSVFSTWVLFDADLAHHLGLAGPLTYQGSHVLPDVNGQRSSRLEVGVVPNHVLARAHGVDGESVQDLAPFKVPALRISVGECTVLLDQSQVLELAGVLQAWLSSEVID